MSWVLRGLLGRFLFWWLERVRGLQVGEFARCRTEMVLIGIYDWASGARDASLWRVLRAAWRAPVPEPFEGK